MRKDDLLGVKSIVKRFAVTEKLAVSTDSVKEDGVAQRNEATDAFPKFVEKGHNFAFGFWVDNFFQQLFHNVHLTWKGFGNLFL